MKFVETPRAILSFAQYSASLRICAIGGIVDTVLRNSVGMKSWPKKPAQSPQRLNLAALGIGRALIDNEKREASILSPRRISGKKHVIAAGGKNGVARLHEILRQLSGIKRGKEINAFQHAVITILAPAKKRVICIAANRDAAIAEIPPEKPVEFRLGE